MKIVHVIFSMEIGGSETMLIDILREQVKVSANVELIIINERYDTNLLLTIDKKVKLTLLNRRKGLVYTLWKVFVLNWYLRRLKPSVLHFHNHDSINLLVRKPKNSVLTVHDVNLESTNWKKFTTLCSISRAVQNDILHRTGLQSVLVYNGIDFSKITQKVAGVRNSKFRIVQVSRLDHLKKGQDVLLQAIDLLKQEYPNIEIQVDFIGGGTSLTYLEELAASLGLENVVNFLGVQTRSYVYENLCHYDLLIQPSIFEGFGLTVAEGMAARVPVLVSDNDGPMEVINNGEFGFFFEKGNAEACAEKIREIMESESLEDLTNRAYDNAYTNFNVEQTALEYFRLYNK